MELGKETIEAQGLSDAQVTAINTLIAGSTDAAQLADLKKEWDGKANEQAEGILTGATKAIAELTKVDRNQGEKVADYMARSFGVMSTDGNTALEAAKAEYNEKVKNFKGKAKLTKYVEEQKIPLDLERIF